MVRKHMLSELRNELGTLQLKADVFKLPAMQSAVTPLQKLPQGKVGVRNDGIQLRLGHLS